MGNIYSKVCRVWTWMGLLAKVFTSNYDFVELKQALTFYMQDDIKSHSAEKSKKLTPTPMIDQFA
jgi:hypothetical protein